MGIFGGLTGLITGIGQSVERNWKAIKGDKASEEAAVHTEQVELIKQFAAEFVSRPRATWWDSFVDGANRLPRPMITFSTYGIFLWALYDPQGFITYMAAISVVPDELWVMWLTIVAFWFGSRLISQDLGKPKITDDQIERARELMAEREKLAKERLEKETIEQPVVVVPTPNIKIVLPNVDKSKQGTPAVEAMITDLIKREGGYVNDPADRGGPTKYGITQATLTAWREKSCSISDVRALTKKEAADIYRAEYYLLPRIDALPEILQAHIFDIGVNSGPRTAIRLLQRALNTFGHKIDEDGIIGPQTLEAVRNAPLADVNNKIIELRVDFYNDIVKRNPENKRFIKGWLARAELFSSKEVA